MRLLFVGDIIGAPGRRILSERLGEIVDAEGIDLVVANAENAAGGFGVTPDVAEELFSFGIHVLTSGNHIWDKKEVMEYLDRQVRLLRPANYPQGCPGTGVAIVSSRCGTPCAVVNLQGRTHMPPTDCPFRKADEILQNLDPGIRVKIVDFHAEATSEKIAMGWYLDGRVSAVLGTHTHVATADERILPHGTAYITDVGMVGATDSVIGVQKDLVLRRFLTGIPVRMEPAKRGVEIQAVIVDIDEPSGQARHIQRYRLAAGY